MKKNISLLIGLILLVSSAFNEVNAQIYNIETENGTTVSACVGAFTDSDGYDGNVYNPGESFMVTFCSSTPGDCLEMDFTQFNIPDGQDWLYVWDGADTASGNFIGRYNNPFGNNTNSITYLYPNGIQSTTGCFTFVFESDGDFIVGSGWSAVITCIEDCPTCYDGIQNGMETDIDCDGVCLDCPDPINIADGGTVEACSNIFVDSGGPDDPYDTGENETITICSDNPNPNYCLLAQFVQWELASGSTLSIYEGTTVSASSLIGSYTGGWQPNPPGTIFASGGCLTFVFTSNTWSADDGWVANISCQLCEEEPLPTIADCLGAMPICGSNDGLTTQPVGSGTYTDILPPITCGISDNNVAYFYFDVTTAGVLNFNLNSTPLTNNYNWSLLNVSGVGCEDLSNSLVVSCNSYSGSGPTGISTALGGVGNSSSTQAYNEDVDVLANQSYVLVVTSQGATSGFDLDFSASTAVLDDGTAPTVTNVIPNCANNSLAVTFSEPVLCTSISELDFLVVGQFITAGITSIEGTWCDGGLEGGTEFTLYLDTVLNENTLYVFSLESSAGGISDLCGNINSLQSYAFNTGQAMTLTTDITPSDCAESIPTGAVDIVVNGGVEPFYLEMLNQYGYDDSVFTFVNLPAGLIPVDVYDGSGCHAIFEIDVPNSNSNMQNDVVIGNVSCLGGDGFIEVSTTGLPGYGPWRYVITDTNGNTLGLVNNNNYIYVGSLAVGEYNIEIEDLSGLSQCPDYQIVFVNEPDSILLTTVADTTICYFGETYLSSTVTGGTGSPFTLHWDDGTNQFTTIPSQSLTFDSLITTTYYDVYAEDDLGCTSDPYQVVVTVNDLLTFDMDSDQLICAGSQTYLSVENITGGEGFGYNVVWDLGGGLVIDQDSVIILPTEATTYCVTVNDQCETPDVDSCIVVSPTLSIDVTFNISSDTASCPPYLATFVNTTDPAYVASATWDFGDGSGMQGNATVNHIFQESGYYDVTLSVTDPDGCVFDTTMIDAITMYPEPIAQFSTDPSNPTLVNSTVQFINESEGAMEYYWVFDTINYLGEAHVENPFFVFPDQLPQEYFNRLSVTNEFGCTDMVTNMLVIEEDLTVYIPNSFSPNGDGKNDFFYVEGLELDPVFFQLMIYDRWGNLVFESSDINEKWNGAINGSDYYSQPGVFVYNLSYKINNTTEKQNVRGTVTLLR
jgi:gliding motility-associated-like protein